MTKKYLGAGVTFALTMAGSAAYAQAESTAPPAAPQATAPQPPARPAWAPPNLLGPGTDAIGRPNFIPSDQAIAAYGEAAVRQVISSNVVTCERRTRVRINREQLDVVLAGLNEQFAQEPNRQRNWSIGRAALGVGQVAVGVAAGGPLYGLLVALGQAQTTGDRVEYARLMRLYIAYMQYYGDEMKQYAEVQQIYFDILDEWCPLFMQWRESVTLSSVSMSYTPAAGATPAAGPESW